MKYIIVWATVWLTNPSGNWADERLCRRPILRLCGLLGVPSGRCGLLKTVPDGYHPGSEIANLSVAKRPATSTASEGRGSLEAASMGVDIESGEMAMSCNLVCIENGRIKNHLADISLRPVLSN